MKVCDAMTPDVQLCTPDDTLRDVAEAMAALGVGLLPVADNERLVGMALRQISRPTTQHAQP